MPALLLFFQLLYPLEVFASAHGGPSSCPPGQMLSYNSMINVRSCTPLYPPSQAPYCVACQQQQFPMPRPSVPLNQFPSAFTPPYQAPWWARQGAMNYPNMYYPGAWNHQQHGMNGQHYPGNGQVFMGKPNIYASTLAKDIKGKITFNFNQSHDNFLATTPALSKDYSWSTRVTKELKFSVAGVNYDYLFYDVRQDSNLMQFEHGLCASKEDILLWMLSDMREMVFPEAALIDFEEHWRVKMPDYPNYCVYPQYSQQMEKVLPIAITPASIKLMRNNYVLLPYKGEINANSDRQIPLPRKSPSLLNHSINQPHFYEWGVGFLDAK